MQTCVHAGGLASAWSRSRTSASSTHSTSGSSYSNPRPRRRLVIPRLEQSDRRSLDKATLAKAKHVDEDGHQRNRVDDQLDADQSHRFSAGGLAMPHVCLPTNAWA